ncbi:hypothetical protein SRB5_19830 [Streptomyces sp. RB5]|uniref:Uncharacterized protein n=1 Tax=Streptomyces smaragdinus TaxID=2585196 RepID=A0A7K0CGJ2_9ACTN|nr:DUF5995 family protein [Streptomyces smaragdinus]MQY11864.1 hypothetical protein [Streptomyces smaragdinus]
MTSGELAASVAARLRGIGDALPPGDGAGVFNGVYLRVVQEAGGAYPALLGAAAERWLGAVGDAAAGRRPPACWRPLLEARRHGGVRAPQFALAGLNAHVGHDLPLAVIADCAAREREPEAARGDFERACAVLERLEERIRDELTPGPELLDVTDPLTHLLGAWSLDRARESAWATVAALWPLRELPGVYEEFARRLDQNTGLVSRCLLTPLLVPR